MAILDEAVKPRRKIDLRFIADPLSSDFVALVNIIFGVTMTQGFVIYRDTIVSPELSPESLSLVLVYCTIILSWIGYHQSVSKYPYNRTIWSRIRLAGDVIILVVYAFLIFVALDPQRVLSGLALVFVLYVFNGFVRWREWSDRKVSHPILSLEFAIGFVILALAYWLLHGSDYIEVRYSIVLLSFFPLFGYRVVRTHLGYPTVLAIGIDIDGVLADQVSHVLTRLRSKGQAVGITKDMVAEWDYSLGDRTITDEIEEALLDPQFIEEMPVIHGSIDSMKYLHGRHHVVIATARPLGTEQATLNWLRKHFLYHEYFNTRAVGKSGHGLKVLVDDNPQNIEDFASSGGTGVLFSQPWNMKDTKKMEDLVRTKRVVRCDDWSEVLAVIEEITMIQ